jgi:hypothetical protein
VGESPKTIPIDYHGAASAVVAGTSGVDGPDVQSVGVVLSEQLCNQLTLDPANYSAHTE